jgi:hypothetical protein
MVAHKKMNLEINYSFFQAVHFLYGETWEQEKFALRKKGTGRGYILNIVAPSQRQRFIK